MNDENSKPKGVIVPIITPIDTHGNIDETAFKAMIDHCIDAGIDGIFVGGSSGMGPLLTDDQWKTMAQTASEHIQDRCILFGGVICTSTERAIERIAFLDKCGYKYMAVTPTYYITLTYDEQFLTHFQACSDATDMEMVVYNIPSCTYSQIPLAVLETMAQKGLYRILKESGGDRDYFSEVMKIAAKYDLTVLQGNEPDIEWGFSIGAGGIVPVCANYEPKTYAAAYKASLNDDTKLLKHAQQRASLIRETLLVKADNWISGIMYGVSTLGIGNGKPLRPLLEISPEAKARIDTLDVIDISEDIL